MGILRATLSDATLSDATLSEATLLDATLPEAIGSSISLLLTAPRPVTAPPALGFLTTAEAAASVKGRQGGVGCHGSYPRASM